MKITDPISDMLTRIRNANSANKAEVSMPSTKVLVEVARVICEEGYIAGYEVEDDDPQKTLHITLKYGERHAKVIRGIRRISKPGLRIYSTADKLPRVLGGLGTAVISTSKGMMCRPRCSQAGHRRRGHRLRLVILGRNERRLPCLVLVRSLSRFRQE